jgi:cell division protein FtsB
MRSRKLRTAVVVALVLAALALSFELGRNQAGFSLLDQRETRATYDAELERQAATIDELERELAILRRSSQIDTESNAAVSATLAELEARLQAQAEELAFYRGIISPGDSAAGLRIQNIEIQREGAGTAYRLRLLLAQTSTQVDPVRGELRANLHGTRDNEPVTYSLADLDSGNPSGAIAFEFQYFQALETELSLPDGFEPYELEVEVWPRSPQGETIVETFPWSGYEG